MKKYLPLLLLVFLALLGFFWWIQFALPRYQFIDLSVRRQEAVEIASGYLRSLHYDISGYRFAALFEADDATDRYLQRTLGILPAQALLKKLDYELFGWSVRFFKEKQKEEFWVFVSSRTGRVLAFNHAIEETAARPSMDKESAKAVALAFLKSRFGFDPATYTLQHDDSKKELNRIDHMFTWEARDVHIPWKQEFGGGSAKLLTTVTVSGGEVLSFSRMGFDIPEGFSRYVQNLKQTGENLTLIFRICYLCLLTMAIMMVVNRKNHYVPRVVKFFYVRIGIFLYVLLILEVLNSCQYLFYSYPTTQAFGDYILRRVIENIVNPFFIVLAFILPGLAGESLRFEVDKAGKERGFFSTVLSSFFSRPTALAICTGYCLSAFILGVQAVIYDFGYHYCGVWEELSWLTRASSSYFPALTALLIGLQASFSEETMFRLFGINLFKRFGLGAWAVILTALMWGVGHTAYPVFPMWFRGLEVTCLGVILGFAYLRYGFLAVITAHYLMDAFLTCMPHVISCKLGTEFFASIFVLGLPLLIALAAALLNRDTREREWTHHLNAQQRFNYALLTELVANKPRDQRQMMRVDLIKHGWDPVVVDKAIPEFKEGGDV